VEQVSRAELVDGSVISLRRLSSSDADDVIRLYETLTDDECYLRFFTMHPAHLHACARSLAESSDDQYALGAFDSETLLGVANYFACTVPGYAEVAVVVAHDEHMRGVGTALLGRLGEIAKANGFHHLVAEVLTKNYLMLRLMSDAGWPCTRHYDGSVLRVEVDLDAISPGLGDQ
jgi:hypothetical protein